MFRRYKNKINILKKKFCFNNCFKENGNINNETNGLWTKLFKTQDKRTISKDIMEAENLKSSDKKQDDREGSAEEPPSVGFLQLYQFATGMERFLLFIGFLGALVTGIITAINNMYVGDVIGDLIKWEHRMVLLANNQSASTNYTSQDFADAVENFTTYNFLLGLDMFIFSYISIWSYNLVANKQIYKIRSLYLKSILSQNIGWYDIQNTGEFASRMSEDLSKLEDGIGEKVVQFQHFVFSFVCGSVVAFAKGWRLSLVCFTSIPVTMISIWIVTMISSRLSEKAFIAYGKAGTIAEQVLSSIRTVVAFGGQKSEVKRYKANLVHAKNIHIRREFFSGLGSGLVWFLSYASYALIFWYGVGLILDERHLPDSERIYDPATLCTIFFNIIVASTNFTMSSPYIEAFSIAKGAGARIFSVINRISPINSWSNSGGKPHNLKGNISLKNVKFAYPTRPEVEVLQGLSLDIKRGETVALVGRSGCGKSTCIQLIQRFYDPLEGTIMLDNHDVKMLNVSWLRNHIGVVGQEPVLFNTTIAENIQYGFDLASQSQIEDAAKEANAHDFISKLPQGYNTLVGERGAQLSGGQKQRIAIARALVRKPVILLLDEATSALDTTSEAKVQKALNKVHQGRTTVIVAHRLSTIRNADKIIVLSEGKVVEQGTHKDLMARQGYYHALVTVQQLNSLDENENTGEDINEEKLLTNLSSTVNKASFIGTEDYDQEENSLQIDYSLVEETAPSISILQILKKNKPEWMLILVGSTGSILFGFSMLAFSMFFADTLEVLAGQDKSEARDESNTYCLYYIIAGIITGFSSFVSIYTYGIAGEKLTMRLRGELFEAMLKQEIAWFDEKSNNSGSLCARLSGEASSVQGATGQRVGIILQSMATISLGVGLSFFYQWKLCLIIMTLTPFILLAHFFYQKTLTGEILKNQKAMEKSIKLAVEAIGNIRTVASLGQEKSFHQQYMSELHPAHNLSNRNTHFRAIVYALARSVVIFVSCISMYYSMKLMVEEGVGFQNVFKVSHILVMGTVSLANALAFAPNFQKGKEAAARIFHLLARKPQIYDPPSIHNAKWVAEGNVNYKNIEFIYPTRKNIRVLQGLNLEVLKGKTVALVGQSGCGKSTCVQLLERFYDPVSGVVNLDDRDISSITLHSLRSQIGIVSQEPVLFDRTIAENIAYGDNTREVHMAEIIESAKIANIHNFIINLPHGYQTRIGEKGIQLSGGQKQRVAIARVLVRNPRVLLLDEATSALDTGSEKVVQEALDKAKEGRTCITIAHRLSTIQDADVICVIHHGKVAELGTHNELLSKHGLYYKLCRMQN